MFALGSTLDYMQSKNSLGETHYEANPFLPNHPSSDRLLLQKVVSTGFIYWSLDTIEYEPYRRRGLLIVNGIQWGVVVRNEYIGATFKYNW